MLLIFLLIAMVVVFMLLITLLFMHFLRISEKRRQEHMKQAREAIEENRKNIEANLQMCRKAIDATKTQHKMQK